MPVGIAIRYLPMQQETEAELIIRAKVDDIMDVIADLPSYPLWCPGVRRADVLQTFDNGRPKEVLMVLDSGPIHDTLQYVYDWSTKNEVQWWQTQGETLKSLKGRYSCRRLGHNQTLVSYMLTIELAMPMISALQRRAEKHIVSTALEGLKHRVEELSA